MSQQGSATGDNNGSNKKFRMSFNQDYTSLQMCGYNGYRIFSIIGPDLLEPIYSNSQHHTIYCERLFNSSLVAIVSQREPRTLELRHYKKSDNICKYSYSESILAIKLTRKRLVVVVEESIYIHNIKDMKLVHSIRDTPPNPNGLCALSIHENSNLLAYPGSNVVGEVQIFDTVNLQAKIMISAHDNPLAALAFNSDASKIATASDKGTVIRVFNVIDGGKLYEFRRGVKRCVEVYSLTFSKCSTFLGCTSNTETIHIFKLEDPDESKSSSESSGIFGYVSSFLPSQVTGVFTQDRAFCYAYLPRSGFKTCICIFKDENELRLMVATDTGVLNIYTVNCVAGGSMELHKSINVLALCSELEQAEELPPVLKLPPGSTMLGSYAGILKGNPPGHMSGTGTSESAVSQASSSKLSDRDDLQACSANKPQELTSKEEGEGSNSETTREMAAAMESPPKDGLQLNDHREYPPLFPKKD